MSCVCTSERRRALRTSRPTSRKTKAAAGCLACARRGLQETVKNVTQKRMKRKLEEIRRRSAVEDARGANLLADVDAALDEAKRSVSDLPAVPTRVFESKPKLEDIPELRAELDLLHADIAWKRYAAWARKRRHLLQAEWRLVRQAECRLPRLRGRSSSARRPRAHRTVRSVAKTRDGDTADGPPPRRDVACDALQLGGAV